MLLDVNKLIAKLLNQIDEFELRAASESTARKIETLALLVSILIDYRDTTAESIRSIEARQQLQIEHNLQLQSIEDE